jgi:2-enoate reductase
MAKRLAEAGFDALHVDAGCYDSWYWPHPPIYQAHGCMVDMAAAVKKALSIPVIGVGRLDIPELAEAVIREGKADMVALGRALLVDPLWVRKVEMGQPERIRPCIGCFDGCMGRIFAGKPLCCAVNPQVGRERTYAVGKADGSRRVIVVGGGVAGLEAARTAALRGHHVTLYEKNNTLGGNLLPASVPSFKQDLKRLLAWYESELQDLDLGIILGFEATSDFIESEKADGVIIATGARPIVPSIPGIQQENIVTASEVLLGKKQIGHSVIVVGGGLVGCETAIWLAQHGKKVTVVEIFHELMTGSLQVPYMTRLMISDMLKFNKVEVLTETRPLEITDDAVLLMRGSSEKESLRADTVVLSLGLSPDKKLYDALVGKIPNLYLIGDSREARNIMGAIWDAYEVARAI